MNGTLSENGIVIMNQTEYLKLCYISLIPLEGEGTLVNLSVQGEPSIFSLSDFYYNTDPIDNFIGNTDIDDENVQSSVVDIQISNYPNPFNPSTTFIFSLPQLSDAELQIYNIKGQLIRTLKYYNYDLISNNKKKSIFWNGTDEKGRRVSSGSYFCKLRIGKRNNVYHKIILMK